MKTLIRSMTLLVCLAMGGCIVTSIQPLHSDEVTVFDAALLGAWGDTDDNSETWVFHEHDGDYTLIFTETDGATTFDAWLVRLGDQLFLDLAPSRDQLESVERLSPLFHASHLLMKVELEGDSLQLSTLDPDWFRDRAERGEQTVSGVSVGDDAWLLTVSTQELQALVRDHADDAFGDEPLAKLRRLGEKAQENERGD